MTEGTIGLLSYYCDFPPAVEVHGFRIGEPAEVARAAFVREDAESSPKYGIDVYTATTAKGIRCKSRSMRIAFLPSSSNGPAPPQYLHQSVPVYCRS